MPDDLEMDDVDRRILDALVSDGRASVQAVADQVGLRRPAVHARIQRLEASGIIRGYHAELAPDAVGSGMVGFVFLQVAHGAGRDCMTSASTIVQDLQKIPGVLEAHTMAGDDDMLVKVRVGSLRELEDLVLRRMSGLANVNRVRTSLALSTHFERPLRPREKPAKRKAARSRSRSP
jgi:Lrp/AsnC family leucine-responsive transcriptional regulator